MINPNLKARDRIFKELPEDLRKLMERFVLPENMHKKVLNDIKNQSYYGKKPVDNPKFIIVAGQTGSGKSNVTSYICSKNDNLVVIDSDKLKAYRPDNNIIMREHMQEYGYLTAPDAYLHRDEMIVDSMKSKYNILMECAPSKKEGLFVDIDEIKENGYEVEIHVLGVGSLNSILSVHERYEASLELSSNTAKLTSLSRHDDSYDSLITSILNEQKKNKVSIYVYKRGEKYPFEPIMIYNPKNNMNFSCPAEALIYAQLQDVKKTMPNALNRYKVLYEQMQNRNAPQGQVEQLQAVKEIIELFIENYNERG